MGSILPSTRNSPPRPRGRPSRSGSARSNSAHVATSRAYPSHMADVDAARRALEEALGPERVLSDPLALRLYARDASMVEGGCALVVFPESTDELVACVWIANEPG